MGCEKIWGGGCMRWGGGWALLEERGAAPSPPNALPTTLPEGMSTSPIPPPLFQPPVTAPPTDFTVRPNRFVTALSWPPERPPLQANPWGGGGWRMVRSVWDEG